MMKAGMHPICTRGYVIQSMASTAILLVPLVTMPVDGWGQDSDSTDHWVGITVEPVAVLRVAGAGAPSFAIREPATPGAAPVITIDDAGERFLQFTSIVSTPEATRRITASHDGGVPEGLILHLRMWDGLDGPGAQGALGTTGGGSGWQNTSLSETDQDAVWEIGSGFTGTGVNDGWKFTYGLTVSNQVNSHVFWSSLTAQTASVQVTFTLTEEEDGNS